MGSIAWAQLESRLGLLSFAASPCDERVARI